MNNFISGIGLLAAVAIMIYIPGPKTWLVKAGVKIENQFNMNIMQHKTIN